MDRIIPKILLGLYVDSPKYYLIDRAGNYITDVLERCKVCTPINLSTEIQIETEFQWEVFRDDFERARGTVGLHYIKKKTKERIICSAYSFEQLEEYIEKHYPEIEIKIELQGNLFKAELIQVLSLTDRVWAKTPDIHTIEKSPYKPQALLNCLFSHRSTIEFMKNPSFY